MAILLLLRSDDRIDAVDVGNLLGRPRGRVGRRRLLPPLRNSSRELLESLASLQVVQVLVQRIVAVAAGTVVVVRVHDGRVVVEVIAQDEVGLALAALDGTLHGGVCFTSRRQANSAGRGGGGEML